MSILTVAQGIESVVKKLSAYNSSNTAIGNYVKLDAGVTRAIIIEYLPSTHGPGQTPAHAGKYVSTHNFLVRIHRKYEEDGTSYENMLSDVSDVKEEIDKYRKLDGVSGVLRALVVSSGNPEALFDRNGNGPYFIRIDLTLEVKEETEPDYKE